MEKLKTSNHPDIVKVPIIDVNAKAKKRSRESRPITITDAKMVIDIDGKKSASSQKKKDKKSSKKHKKRSAKKSESKRKHHKDHHPKVQIPNRLSSQQM